MEKRYFVLKKGYLNINEDFFYFNDHGNWKTCEVLEETEMTRLTFFFISKQFIQVTYLVISIIFAMSLLTGKFDLSYSILFLMVVFKILHLRYKIKYFKVPLSKIEQIALTGNELTITFLNRTNTSTKHAVKLDDQREIKDIQQFLQAYFQPKLHIT